MGAKVKDQQTAKSRKGVRDVKYNTQHSHMDAVRTLRLKDELSALWRGDGEVNIHAGTSYHLDVHKQRRDNNKQQRMFSHSRNFNPRKQGPLFRSSTCFYRRNQGLNLVLSSFTDAIKSLLGGGTFWDHNTAEGLSLVLQSLQSLLLMLPQ